jgi:hypothetical protein
MLRIPLVVLLLLNSAPALAIYKCEAGGKITYSDAPCLGAKVKELAEATGNSVSPADATHAKQQLVREKSEAARLEKARRQREAVDEKERRQAAKSAATRKRNCAVLAQRKKWSDEDAAAASGRSAEKARLKARRMTEKYEAACKTA